MLFLQPSQKQFLSTINPLVMVLLVACGITLRTTVDPFIPIFSGLWDVLFAWVVYVGQRRSFFEGGVLVLFAGHLYSLSTSAPFGVYLIYYVILFLVARLLTYVIYANRGLSIFGLLLALSLLSRGVLWLVASLFGHRLYAVSHLTDLLGYAVFNSCIGLGIYSLVGFVDRITFKVLRVNIEMVEGDL